MATRTRKTAETQTQETSKVETPKKVEEPKKVETPMTVEELKASPRFVKTSEFHEMVKHQVSVATIYNRVRGKGKDGKPTRERLEGVQAEDRSWWIDLEGEEVKKLLKQEEAWKTPMNEAADDTIHLRKGMTPAELREMLSKAIEKLVDQERENEALTRKLNEAQEENEALKEEMDIVKMQNKASNEAMKETQRQLDETKTKLLVAETRVDVMADVIGVTRQNEKPAMFEAIMKKPING